MPAPCNPPAGDQVSSCKTPELKLAPHWKNPARCAGRVRCARPACKVCMPSTTGSATDAPYTSMQARAPPVTHQVNNGTHKSGFATSQAVYDRAQRELYAALDELEARLGQTASWSATGAPMGI